MISTPLRALRAIEGIDAVFVKRKSREKRISVSFSGLLHAIDSVAWRHRKCARWSSIGINWTRR